MDGKEGSWRLRQAWTSGTLCRVAEAASLTKGVTLALVLLAIAALPSCGPSVQSIHEGSVRFEHCYRLDLDPGVATSHREACWREWSTRYTYGQSRDRIEYARRRLRAIALGDPEPPRLDVSEERRPEERQFYLSVPAPTSAHASPPPIATRPYAANGAQPAADAPGDRCAQACRAARSECMARCPAEAEPKAGKRPRKAAPGGALTGDAGVCGTCDVEYKDCVRRCYE